MSQMSQILVTGAGGGVGGVGRSVVSLLREQDLPVRAFVYHDDERADTLRALGADVFVGDLERPSDVAEALDGCRRMFFGMSVSPSYLEAAATVATVARATAELEVLVNISQLTVSQMTAVSATSRITNACTGSRSACSTGPTLRSCTSARPSSSRTPSSRR